MISELMNAFENFKKKNEQKVDENFDTVLSTNPRYKELLQIFCNNKELQELIFYCMIDIEDSKEEFYVKNGQYPPTRDGLMKLRYDLEFSRKAILVKELNGGKK